MHSEVFASLIQPIQTTRTIIWVALNVAILAYVGVACSLFGVPSSTADAFGHPLAMPLIALAVANAVAGRVLPPMMLPRQRLHDLLNRDTEPRDLARDPRTGTVDNERLRKLQTLPQREQRLIAIAQASFSPFIVQLALQESVALYGLILAFLSKTAAPLIPFATAALILNLTVSPQLTYVFDKAQRPS
jgi:hypothetical protein